MLADAVDRCAAVLLLDARLDAGEPLVDAAPAGGDEVDEQREVVDARVPLGEEVAFDALEPADQLVHQAAHLGEVAGDGEHLRAQAVLDGIADARGQRRLELGRGGGERLDLLARALEAPRRPARARPLPAAASSIRAFARAIASASIAGDVTVVVGWTSPSWTTSCRTS